MSPDQSPISSKEEDGVFPETQFEGEDGAFPQTQFDGNTDGLFEALEILDERKPKKTDKNKVGMYLLRWAGIDPDTGEPWEPSWGPKNGTTPDLVSEWKAKLAQDPSIMGREGKKWDEAKERGKKAERERLSREKSERASSKKPVSLKRKRESMSVVSNSERKDRASSGRKSSAKSAEPVHHPRTPTSASSRQRSTRTSSVVPASSSTPATPVDSIPPLPRSRTSAPRSFAREPSDSESTESPEPPMEEPLPPVPHANPVFKKKKIIPISSSSTHHAVVQPPPLGLIPTPTQSPAAAGPGPSTSAAARELSPVGPRRPFPPRAHLPISGLAQARVRDFSPDAPNMEEMPPDSEICSYGSQPWMLGDVAVASQGGGALPSDDKGKAQAEAEAKGKRASTGKIVEKGGMSVMVYSSDEDWDDDDDDVGGERGRGKRGEDSEAEEELDTMMDAGVYDDAQLEPDEMQDRTAEAAHPCGWNGCSKGYESAKALRAHVVVHVGSGDGTEDARPTAHTASESHPLDEPAKIWPTIMTLRDQLTSATLRAEGSDTLQMGLNSAEDQREIAEAELGEAGDKAKAMEDVIKGLEEMSGKVGRESEEVEALKEKHGKVVEVLMVKLAEAEKAQAAIERKVAEATNSSDEVHSGLETLVEQLAEAKRDRDQYVRERDALQTQLTDALETSSTSATEITSLTEQLARAERISAMHEGSAAFLRTQYDEARERVGSADRTNKELKAKIEVLREQLSVGLSQRDIFSASVAAQRDSESAKLRSQIRVLLEQARRTDDDVRKKAAFFTSYAAERDILVGRAAEKDAKISELEEENEELVEKVEELTGRMELLRAVKIGAIPDPDEERSEEGSPMGLLREGELPEGAGSVVGVFNIDPRPSVPAEGRAWPCKWVFESGEVCGCLCDTVEELQVHTTGHQVTEIAEQMQMKEMEMLQGQDS